MSLLVRKNPFQIRRLLFHWIAPLAAVQTIAGCGSINIDTGSNGNPPAVSNQTASTPDAGGCWAPARKLSIPIQTLCTSMPAHLKVDYQTALELICGRGKLVNLLNPGCGWNGEGSPLQELRVLKATDINDRQTKDFAYLSAYGLRINPSKFGYARTMVLAITNPDLFAKWFEVPAPAKITPMGTKLSDDGLMTNYRYNLEVNGLAKFGFDGEISVWDLGDGMTAVLNRAVGNLQGVKVRRNMTLIRRDQDGSEQQVSIEERLIPDMGQHQIALSQMIKLDLVELQNRYTNGLATSGPPELMEPIATPTTTASSTTAD